MGANMFKTYSERLKLVQEMLQDSLQEIVEEGHVRLYQLILENKGNPDFDLEIEQIARGYPTLIKELVERYQKEKEDSPDTVTTDLDKDTFKYDVFISYSHKDEDWVCSILLPALENKNLKVCIDYRDFIAGKAAIINMQDASESSRHTLLVMTPRWVESEWTLYEGILSRTEDPSGLKRRTIPLLLEKCEPSKFISMLTWVDFTNKKHEAEAWQNLFKSLE